MSDYTIEIGEVQAFDLDVMVVSQPTTDASLLTSGTLANARLSADVVLAPSGVLPTLDGSALTGTSTMSVSFAQTAAALNTGRTLAITGDLTWTSPTFNGSQNVTATGTLATVNSNVGTYGSGTAIPVITVNGKGLVTSVSTASLDLSSYLQTSDIGSTVQGYDANTTILGNSVTGTGSIVLATSPTLVTPVLGDATATTINKVTIVQPANAATIEIADACVLTVPANATVSGTNTGDQDLSGYVPTSRTVNGQALSGNVTITTITGNAGTATALATPRNINGVAFDGTANITVTAAAGTLTGSTLASGVTASSLTSVGTLTTLTVAGLVQVVNSTTAQAFHVYNTSSSANANYERGVFDWTTTANTLTIGTQSAGTGSTRAINVVVGGTTALTISTGGATTSAYDIGSSNNLYVFNTGQTGNYQAVLGAGSSGVRMVGNWGINWTSQSAGAVNVFAGTVDTGVWRNAAGVVEINNGTAGTFRDLKARNVILDNVLNLKSFTVATVPSASTSGAGATIYVSDAAGAGLGVSDGSTWKSVPDIGLAAGLAIALG